MNNFIDNLSSDKVMKYFFITLTAFFIIRIIAQIYGI